MKKVVAIFAGILTIAFAAPVSARTLAPEAEFAGSYYVDPYDPYAGYYYDVQDAYYSGEDAYLNYYDTYYYDTTYYYYPQPVYYQPQPTYYSYQPTYYQPTTYYQPQTPYYGNQYTNRSGSQYGSSTPSPNNYRYPTGDTDTFGYDICYWEGHGRGRCDFNPRQPVYDFYTGTWY